MTSLVAYSLYYSRLVLLSNSLGSVSLRTPSREAERSAQLITRVVEHSLATETRYSNTDTVPYGRAVDPHIECGSESRRKNECGSGSRMGKLKNARKMEENCNIIIKY